MLKDKIYETIISNETYQQINPTDPVDSDPYLVQTMALEPESLNEVNQTIEDTPVEEVEGNDFKSAILRAIKSNKYFKYIVSADCDENENIEDDDLTQIANFVSLDNKVFLSADNKIIAFQ